MRLEVTQKADHAVRAIIELHASDVRLKSADLAHLLGTTSGFIPQVMSPLVRAGWVRSVSGPSGGYECATDLVSLTVLEVVEAVDGPTDSGRCVVAERGCDAAEPCALHVAWGRARHELRTSLGAMSLADVAGAV